MSRYFVKFGLAGYGPDLDENDEAIPLDQLDYVLCDEIGRAADHAEDTAHVFAESGDFESAWREHERAESLSAQAANFDPKRRNAPLYAGNLPKWLETVTLQLEQTFPLDVSEHERLYVWTTDE